jgi:adenosylcobinamide-phosphate synthase
MSEAALILGAAFILDLLWGDPVYRLHPVRCIGNTACFLELQLRRMHLSGLLGGCFLVLLTLGVALVFSLGLSEIVRHCGRWAVWVWRIYLATSCIALRDLIDHARPVAIALRSEDLLEARVSVQRIVGRDVSYLDEAGVAQAAVETVAENFVDGLLSPLFWYAAGAIALRRVAPVTGALAALIAYRTINTLDAMVGHRSERYLLFGRTAARLDDIMNFIPARLSMPLLALSAAVCRRDGRNALKVALRDRKKHVSHNAGHPESGLAGALHVRLGGPVIYPYGSVEKPWLGCGSDRVAVGHINAACRIVLLASAMAVGLTLLILALLSDPGHAA